MSDTRIVYGARCTWWGSITEIGKLESGLPCCPHCRGVLYEMPDESFWWSQVDRHNETHPGYREFIEWLQGKCFPSYEIARTAYDSSHA